MRANADARESMLALADTAILSEPASVHTCVGHDGLDICEVDVDEPRYRDDVTDALWVQ